MSKRWFIALAVILIPVLYVVLTAPVLMLYCHYESPSTLKATKIYMWPIVAYSKGMDRSPIDDEYFPKGDVEAVLTSYWDLFGPTLQLAYFKIAVLGA